MIIPQRPSQQVGSIGIRLPVLHRSQETQALKMFQYQSDSFPVRPVIEQLRVQPVLLPTRGISLCKI